MDWNEILNWKLLSGSHKFPGPDGGTCISEAAIVAAGFEYCAVSSANNCPPCFSRVLASYAIGLNDNLPDDLRQLLLMPFVTRLAGTADTDEIEWQRFDYIVLGMVRAVLPISLRGWKDDLAAQCAAVSNYDDAIEAVEAMARERDFARAVAVDLSDLALTLRAHDRGIARANVRALTLAVAVALTLSHAHARGHRREMQTAQVALLDGATRIGKQAEPIEQELVIGRLARIRQLELVKHE